jgi:hypothetical protein
MCNLSSLINEILNAVPSEKYTDFTTILFLFSYITYNGVESAPDFKCRNSQDRQILTKIIGIFYLYNLMHLRSFALYELNIVIISPK